MARRGDIIDRVAPLLLVVTLASCDGGVPGPLPSLPPTPTPAPAAPYDCANPPALAGVVQVANAIAGRYIVVLRPRATGASATVSARRAAITARAVTVAQRFAAQDVDVLQSVAGFAATVTATTAARIAADPEVAYVQAEGRKSVRLAWNLDRIDQRALPLDGIYDPGDNGAGVHVAIIDTGIDAAHPDFQGRFGDCFSSHAGGCGDAQGHGTHVAGSVGGRTWGVANGVTLHAVRVLNAQGSGTDSDVIRGIDFVTGLKQANPSWPLGANQSLGGSASPALDQAVCNSIAAGVVHVVAAGNESTDACTTSPARVAQAITLGASDRNDRGADFSNRGQCVDVIGPGVDVESAQRGGGSVSFSGTSMASPHGAGTAALCLQRMPGASPAQVAACVVDNATVGALQGIGSSPNRLLYVRRP